MMPRELWLVRHGESEGNIAFKASRLGDHSHFTAEFCSRHSGYWRLTDLGREQARQTGEWIRSQNGAGFSRYYTSAYLRAMETAALLNLQDAQWRLEVLLRERDRGRNDIAPITGDNHYFQDRFMSRPSGGDGESLADMMVRLKLFFGTLHRDPPEASTLIVCHGEIMAGFMMLLEGKSWQDINDWTMSEHPHDKILNGHVYIYSRIDDTGVEHPHYVRKYNTCPNNPSLSLNDWRKIERKFMSNMDLLNIVEKHPQILTT